MPASTTAQVDAFRGGLRDLGYVEGQKVVLEPRFAEGRPERYPELAAELVRLNVASIVANDPNAVLAAKQASDAIPIVMAGASETPVERGFVASLARPGGNVTGLTQGTPTLPTKRLQLLKDTVPGLARVAFINDPAISPIEANPKVGGLRAAAEALGLRLEVVDLPAPDEFEALFADLGRKQVEGFFPDGSPISFTHRLRLSELAIRHRLPWIGQGSQYKDAALLAYGANSLDVWRRAATYVDKLLKGASPADLPVEQPTVFDFVINLQIARALGLTIPAALLQQATEIVQ
jgi:putative ABC transport system substrate-binding protein